LARIFVPFVFAFILTFLMTPVVAILQRPYTSPYLPSFHRSGGRYRL